MNFKKKRYRYVLSTASRSALEETRLKFAASPETAMSLTACPLVRSEHPGAEPSQDRSVPNHHPQQHGGRTTISAADPLLI